MQLSASIDDSDSVRVIGNSGDVCSETDFCVQNSCSAEYGGTSSTEARWETKDNKNQSNFFIDNSFIHSPHESNFSEVERVERQESKKLSFLEVLSEMGLDIEDWHYIYTREPTSEKDLTYVDEDDRRTKTLHIPESFRGDKNAVMTALRFLSAYGNYAYDDNLQPMGIKNFMDIVLKMLCEMIISDSFIHNGRTVGCSEVIETLSELIRKDYLYEFIIDFKQEWDRILREDIEKHIRNSSAYMKSCLWDWLKRWKIEEYNLLASLE